MKIYLRFILLVLVCFICKMNELSLYGAEVPLIDVSEDKKLIDLSNNDAAGSVLIIDSDLRELYLANSRVDGDIGMVIVDMETDTFAGFIPHNNPDGGWLEDDIHHQAYVIEQGFSIYL